MLSTQCGRDWKSSPYFYEGEISYPSGADKERLCRLNASKNFH
jgi:hypothetical protein